jgi:hypothetical protein
LFSEAVLFWEFGFFFPNGFLLVCGFLFLSKFFEDFFHLLFLLIDAVPISFPFLEQYTTLDLVRTCHCGSLGFAKLPVLLQFAKRVVSLCLCLSVCDTVGALPEKQEFCPEWCHSFQAENVVVVVVFPMVHEDLFSFGTHHQKFTSFLALKRSWWRGEEEEDG